MKVQCISNSVRTLPSHMIRPELGFGPDADFALQIGKAYVVYGMTFFLETLWCYVCDEDDLYYPVWKPCHLFRIVDPRLSSYWKIGVYSIGSAKELMPIIAFGPWVDDPTYYDKLTDGDPNAIAVFTKYKRLIDEEAYTPSAEAS